MPSASLQSYLGFALFNKTAFLAEKVLGNVDAAGIKSMVLAVIVGIGSRLFFQFTSSYGANQPTVEQTLSVVLLGLARFGIFGPGIATGLVSGAPRQGAVAGAGIGAGAAISGGGAAPGLADFRRQRSDDSQRQDPELYGPRSPEFQARVCHGRGTLMPARGFAAGL